LTGRRPKITLAEIHNLGGGCDDYHRSTRFPEVFGNWLTDSFAVQSTGKTDGESRTCQQRKQLLFGL
jgi:hypothetical protein